MLILLLSILVFLAIFYYLEIKRKRRIERMVKHNRKRSEQLFVSVKKPNKENSVYRGVRSASNRTPHKSAIVALQLST